MQGMYANARSHFCVGEGYSEEFKVKVDVHQGSVSACCSSPFCLKPYHKSSTVESPGRTSMQMSLLSSMKECVRRLLTWKEAMEKKGLRVNAGKMKIMICGMGLDLLQSRQVSMHRLSHWSGQQQHLLQRLQALGAQEMQWAQALDKGPWLQTYMVPGNCTSLERQTTEGSPGGTWQARGGSFLLLPRRHALSSRWLWTLTCVKTAWKMWSCVQLLCA